MGNDNRVVSTANNLAWHTSLRRSPGSGLDGGDDLYASPSVAVKGFIRKSDAGAATDRRVGRWAPITCKPYLASARLEKQGNRHAVAHTL